MSQFYTAHLYRHAVAIKYLPPANKKASAHALCNKLLTQLAAANDPRYAVTR